jgi:acetolactate synthase-1/2/3 large subunit
VREADLIVQIGFDPIELRDAWLDAWPQSLPAITVDWGALNHRIFPAGEQALGDVPSILAQLHPEAAVDKAKGWGGRITALREAVAKIVRPRDPAGRISPAALFKTVSDQTSDDWTMVADVGAHRILANHVIRCRTPGQLVQSNGFCTMGFAAGAAIGAALVRPGRPVVAMAGDGGMLMMQGELALAAELGLPIVFVVLNDSSLSLIKLKQEKLQMAPRATDFRAPRFDAIAQGFGMSGVRVDSLAAFDRALRDAVAARRPTLIEAMVDPSEYWEQM